MENNCFRNKEVILNYPIWYSGIFNMTIRRDWLEKGILWVRDLIDVFYNILPIE